MANAIIPMDPIMKDWPAGKEIPSSKAKGKKLYESAQNYIGAAMSGLDGYVKGPSYLDQENSNAEALLVPDRIDLHKDGTVANSSRVYQPVSGLDAMLGAVWNTDNPVQPDTAEMSNPDGYRQMGPYGPVTRIGAGTNTFDLENSPPEKLSASARAYERPMLSRERSSPRMFNKTRKTVNVSSSLRDRPTAVIRPGNLVPSNNGVRAAGVGIGANLAVRSLNAKARTTPSNLWRHDARHGGNHGHHQQAHHLGAGRSLRRCLPPLPHHASSHHQQASLTCPSRFLTVTPVRCLAPASTTPSSFSRST